MLEEGLQWDPTEQDDAGLAIAGFLKCVDTRASLFSFLDNFSFTLIESGFSCPRCHIEVNTREQPSTGVLAVPLKPTLEESLKAFFTENEFPYRCEYGCNNTYQVKRQVHMHQSPKVLIMIIQRTYQQLENSEIRLPAILDLQNHCTNSKRLGIVGFIVRKARQVKSGHYYTIRKHKGKWFTCDDCRISERIVDENNIQMTENHHCIIAVFYEELQ